MAEYKVGLNIGNEWQSAIQRLQTELTRVDQLSKRALSGLSGKASQQNINQTTNALTKLQDQLRRINAVPLKVATKAETNQAITGIKSISSSLGRLHREGKITTTQLQRMNAEVAKSNTMWSGHKAALGGTTKELNTMDAAFDRVNARVKQFASFIAAAMVLRGLYTAFREAHNAVVEYDQALHNLQAIIRVNETQAKILGDTIRGVARETKFSASEIADGMRILGQAGLDMGEAMVFIKGTANLATGTMEDFAKVADLTTSALNAFHLEAVEGSRIADIFANAINESKLNVDKLKVAFNYVGAASHQAGLELNDTAGTLMVLADNGMRMSTAGTGLRRVILRMIAPTSTMRSTLRNLNIELEDINPGVVGWEQALKNLRPAIWDTERQTVDMAKAASFFGVRAAQAASIIFSSTDVISQATAKTYEYGAAAEMAGKQQEGLGIVLKNLSDRLKLIAVGIGEEGGLIEQYKFLLNGARNLSSGLESLILKANEVDVSISNLAAKSAVGGTQLATYATTAYVAGRAIMFLASKLQIAIGTAALTAGKFFIITAALAGLGVAFTTILKKSEKAEAALNKLAATIEANAQATDKWKNSLIGAFGTNEWFNSVNRFKEEHGEIADAIETALVQRGIPGLEYFTGSVEDLKNAFDAVKAEYFVEQLEIATKAAQQAATHSAWGNITRQVEILQGQLGGGSLTEYGFALMDENQIQTFTQSMQTMVKALELSFDEVADFIRQQQEDLIWDIGDENTSRVIENFIDTHLKSFEHLARTRIVELQRMNDAVAKQEIQNLEEFLKHYIAAAKRHIGRGGDLDEVLVALQNRFRLTGEFVGELRNVFEKSQGTFIQGMTVFESLRLELERLNPEFIALYNQLNLFEKIEFREGWDKINESLDDFRTKIIANISGFENLNQAINNLGEQTVLSKVNAEFGIAFENIQQVEEHINSLTDQRIKDGLQELFNKFSPENTKIKETIVTFADLRAELEEQLRLVKLTSREKEIYNLISKATVPITKDQEKELAKLLKTIKNMEDVPKAFKELNEAIFDLTANDLEKELKDINDQIEKWEKSLGDVYENSEELLEVYRALKIESLEIQDPWDRMEDAQKRGDAILQNRAESIQKALANALDFQEIEKATETFFNKVESNFLTIEDVGLNVFKSLEDTLVDTFMTGKISARDMVNSILRDLMRMQIQKTIIGPLASFMDGFSLFSAKGHAFDGGQVQAYARGGVINTPTMFSHSDGAGLMGEAGPEAILPLTRIGGDLGVKTDGGGKQDVRIHIHNESGQKMQVTDSRSSFDAQGMIIDLWIDGFQRNKHGLRNMLGA